MKENAPVDRKFMVTLQYTLVYNNTVLDVMYIVSTRYVIGM